MRSNSLIREQTNHHIAILGTYINNVNQSWMHDIANHAQINCFCHIITILIFHQQESRLECSLSPTPTYTAVQSYPHRHNHYA